MIMGFMILVAFFMTLPAIAMVIEDKKYWKHIFFGYMITVAIVWFSMLSIHFDWRLW